MNNILSYIFLILLFLVYNIVMQRYSFGKPISDEMNKELANKTIFKIKSLFYVENVNTNFITKLPLWWLSPYKYYINSVGLVKRNSFLSKKLNKIK